MKHIKNLNTALREIKSIRMTEAEKASMLSRIMNTPVAPASVQSPYPYGVWSPVFKYVRVSYSWVRHHSSSSAFVALLAVLLVWGGVGAAAQDSLPGDSLYPLKINVMEPARQSLALSSHAKARVAADLAGERLQEAATLAVRGSLDASKQAELQVLIETHTATFASAVSDVRIHNPALAEKDSSDFEKSMDTHATSLVTLARGKTASMSAQAPSQDSVLEIPVTVTKAVMTKTIAIPSAAASSSAGVIPKHFVSINSPLMQLSNTAHDAAEIIRNLR